MIDSHIHLDQFSDEQIAQILSNDELQNVLAVATNLASAQRLLELKKRFPKMYMGAGFHPEQKLPSEDEINTLFAWIEKHRADLTCCGEIGLPHYLKRENPNLDYAPYLALFERFIAFCKETDLPLNLHIVYDDTLTALALLEKYQIHKAHFHWFKASPKVIEKLLATDYMVSLTPDILWNPKTQAVAKAFPLHRLLIETDAPWQHEGFAAQEIVAQLSAVIEKIAALKSLAIPEVAQQIKQNAVEFYGV